MKKIVLYLSIVFSSLNCSTNESVTDSNITFIKGTVNEQKMVGDGITFFREDSTLHFRGFLGNLGFHYQIDIELYDRYPGKYFYDSLSVHSAFVSEIVGMDAQAAGYSPQSRFSNYIAINFDTDYEYLSGDLKFSGFGSGYNRSISVICVFKVKIGQVGQTMWDCDFSSDDISNCRFLN